MAMLSDKGVLVGLFEGATCFQTHINEVLTPIYNELGDDTPLKDRLLMRAIIEGEPDIVEAALACDANPNYVSDGHDRENLRIVHTRTLQPV